MCGAHASSPKTFVTGLLVHIHEKEKIALEIAVKVVSVNRPLCNRKRPLCARFQFCQEKVNYITFSGSIPLVI